MFDDHVMMTYRTWTWSDFNPKCSSGVCQQSQQRHQLPHWWYWCWTKGPFWGWFQGLQDYFMFELTESNWIIFFFWVDMEFIMMLWKCQRFIPRGAAVWSTDLNSEKKVIRGQNIKEIKRVRYLAFWEHFWNGCCILLFYHLTRWHIGFGNSVC